MYVCVLAAGPEMVVQTSSWYYRYFNALPEHFTFYYNYGGYNKVTTGLVSKFYVLPLYCIHILHPAYTFHLVGHFGWHIV